MVSFVPQRDYYNYLDFTPVDPTSATYTITINVSTNSKDKTAYPAQVPVKENGALVPIQPKVYTIQKKVIMACRENFFADRVIDSENRATYCATGSRKLLCDRLDEITNDFVNRPLRSNLIFSTAFLGNFNLLREILAQGCSSADTSNAMTVISSCSLLPNPLINLIRDYCLFFQSNGVKDIATLTCEDNENFVPIPLRKNIDLYDEEESYIEEEESYIEYVTPFQETLKGLLKALRKEKIREFIETLKLLLESGESINRFPALETESEGTISIRQEYENSLPYNFFDNLITQDVTTLTETVHTFQLWKKAANQILNVIKELLITSEEWKIRDSIETLKQSWNDGKEKYLVLRIQNEGIIPIGAEDPFLEKCRQEYDLFLGNFIREYEFSFPKDFFNDLTTKSVSTLTKAFYAYQQELNTNTELFENEII